MLPALLTYAQAAADLAVSTATVRRLVQAGKLIGVAITPRCHRVDAVSVRAYLRQAQIPTRIPCPSGRTAAPGAGASCAEAVSLRAALEAAKRRGMPSPPHAAR